MKKTKWFVAALAACALVLFAAGCDNGSDGSGETEPVAVEAIGLDPSSCSINVGKERKLTVIVKPNEASGVKVTWSSSKDEVATVGSDGTVKALKVGTAIITAQAGEKKGECEVTVIICPHYYAEGKCIYCGLQKPVIDGGTINEYGQLTKYTGKETELVIPDGVTTVGGFEGCTTLTKVTIPDSVMEIWGGTFKGCTSLKEIQFKGTKEQWKAIKGSDTVNIQCIQCSDGYIGIKEIPEYLKMNGTIVTGYTGTVPADLVIPDGVTSIDYQAFKNCKTLTKVTIPESVTNIGSSAFYGCTSLTTVTIPESVTEIGSQAFYECTNLKEVTIPEGVTEIEYNTFSGCTSLESVTIPESVVGIGSSVFSGCESLTEVKIPEGVTSITESMFSGCTSLTTVTIPESVTEIGNYAFYKCESLKEVTIPDGVTEIGSYAFYNCEKLTSVNYAGTKAQWEKIEGISGARLSGKTIVCKDGEVTVE